MDFREQLHEYLALVGDRPLLRAAIVIVLAILVAKLVDLVMTRVLAHWAKRSDTDVDDRLIALSHRPVFLSVLFLGLWLAFSELGLPVQYGQLVLRVLKTVMILVWLGFAVQIVSLALEVVSRLEGRFALIQPRTLPLFDKTSKIVILGGALYFLFLSWGIDVGAWMVSAGVLGIAVGFAAKDTLANLFSGIFILADAPYKVGDFVVLDSGERGQVNQIGLRSTRLLTRDDIEITVPNAVIANAKIINESGGPWVKERVRVPIGVAYGSDIDHVRRVLTEIAAEEENLASNPEPRVRFRAFGNSSLDFELLGWIDEPLLRGRVIDALLCAIYKRFAAESIEIPYPKRDVYLHTVGDDG